MLKDYSDRSDSADFYDDELYFKSLNLYLDEDDLDEDDFDQIVLNNIEKIIN